MNSTGVISVESETQIKKSIKDNREKKKKRKMATSVLPVAKNGPTVLYRFL